MTSSRLSWIPSDVVSINVIAVMWSFAPLNNGFSSPATNDMNTVLWVNVENSLLKQMTYSPESCKTWNGYFICVLFLLSIWFRVLCLCKYRTHLFTVFGSMSFWHVWCRLKLFKRLFNNGKFVYKLLEKVLLTVVLNVNVSYSFRRSLYRTFSCGPSTSTSTSNCPPLTTFKKKRYAQ